MASEMAQATKEVEVAKEQIAACDQQNAVYKTALRNLTNASASESDSTTNNNTLSIEWIKCDPGTSKETPSKLVLQLSSPVEEATLYFNDGKQVQFTGVEIGQATLSLTGHWENSSTGTSESQDVSKFTHELMDALQLPKPYDTVLKVPIESSSKEVLCTASLKVIYTPSVKDIREELCELLGKGAIHKAEAREELRKATLAVHQLTTTTTPKPPAVPAGFLQKSKAPPPPPAWYRIWWERATIVVPVIKNYVLFVGFTVAAHYYGHHLAIPPPV